MSALYPYECPVPKSEIWGGMAVGPYLLLPIAGGLGGNSIGLLDRLTDGLKMGDGLKMSDFGLGMS